MISHVSYALGRNELCMISIMVSSRKYRSRMHIWMDTIQWLYYYYSVHATALIIPMEQFLMLVQYMHIIAVQAHPFMAAIFTEGDSL